jgi:hypothetical protein
MFIHKRLHLHACKIQLKHDIKPDDDETFLHQICFTDFSYESGDQSNQMKFMSTYRNILRQDKNVKHFLAI